MSVSSSEEFSDSSDDYGVPNPNTNPYPNDSSEGNEYSYYPDERSSTREDGKSRPKYSKSRSRPSKRDRDRIRGGRRGESDHRIPVMYDHQSMMSTEDDTTESEESEDSDDDDEQPNYKYKPKNPSLSKKRNRQHLTDDSSSETSDDDSNDSDEEYEDQIKGGLCGDKRIGLLGVWEINVKWNTLPICLINPRFCTDLWRSENKFLLLLSNIEFYLHLIVYFLNFSTWILYWVVMWWVLGEDQDSWMEKLGRIIISPLILVVGTCVLIPFEFIFKYWAIYSAGIGKNPIIGYTIYTLASIILFVVHVYCLVGFAGTMGIYSMVEAGVEGNRGHPDRAKEGYFNLVVAVSGVMCLGWILCIVYSMGILTLLLCKCRRNVTSRNRPIN